MRRAVAMVGCFCLVCALASLAWAGSYLDRAAILLDETRREGDVLHPRVQDKELVRVVQAMADARAKIAHNMEVPPAVASAHPHLLLVLENAQRMVEAARVGNFKKFIEHLTTARDEDRAFRSLLKELGYALPAPLSAAR